MAGKRTHIATVMKGFRFTPEMCNDMERVLTLTGDKYGSLNAIVVEGVTKIIDKERRIAEDNGAAWDHINVKE